MCGKQSVCKSVLIISPAFAPLTSVGAARMTSLAGYLIKNDYKVTVISVGNWFFKDKIWSRKVPDGIKLIEMNRTAIVKNKLKRLVSKTVKKEKYNICITSMGPYYTQWFLWRICKKNKIPLILDYRDPWFEDFKAYDNIREYIMCFFEWCNIKYASKVVSVTDNNTEVLKNRYKKYADKMITIYNGHENLEKYKPVDKCDDTYSIVCIGKFLYYNPEAAKKFLMAISRLKKENINVNFYHVGEEEDNASNVVNEMGIEQSCYRYLGKKNYEDAMQVLCNMDAALIIYALKDGLGTKVFDYIGLNKPIIYCGTKPSELSDFISQYSNVVVTDTVDELVNGMRRMVNDHIITLEEKPREFYSRKAQNDIYMHIIEEVLSR